MNLLSRRSLYFSAAQPSSSRSTVPDTWMKMLAAAIERRAQVDGTELEIALDTPSTLRTEVAEELRPERHDLFLAVLSSEYLRSSRCQGELDAFIASHGRAPGRVFALEREAVHPAELPTELQALRLYRAWIGRDAQASVPVANPSGETAEERSLTHVANELWQEMRPDFSPPTITCACS